ncbi:hypothetical protein AB0912_07145 [Streptomyces sp. NPDC007084]|uniref:hypothetical protein n=1 Tax=Streptomyces sp. NPDC007084 TaxID=3154313 RepID=UPI003455AA3C
MSAAHPINEPEAVGPRHTVAPASRPAHRPERSTAPPARQVGGSGNLPVPDRPACVNRWCTVIF